MQIALHARCPENTMPSSKAAMVSLVLGGVRSGKSRYAQRLAGSAKRVTFVATAERRNDAEMHAKIERHRAERPETWTTIEEPLHLGGIIQKAGKQSDVLVIDCLTLFASNVLQACGDDRLRVESHVENLCSALRAAPCSIVLVSNEVGSGVVPAYELGRRFRDFAGEINQRVASVADTVVLMIAGLPMPLKGSLPDVEVRA